MWTGCSLRSALWKSAAEMSDIEEAERATAGFAPTTPLIGRRQVAARRAAAALAEVG